MKSLQAKTRFLKMFVFSEDSRTDSGALVTGWRMQLKKSTTKRRHENSRRRMVPVVVGLLVPFLSAEVPVCLLFVIEVVVVKVVVVVEVLIELRVRQLWVGISKCVMLTD